MDQIRSLYQQEIDAYKEEIASMRLRIGDCEAKNLSLVGQLATLEEEMQQTKRANNYLRTAFQHIHEENTHLQLPSQPESQPAAITETDTQNDAGEVLSWVSDRPRLNERIKFLERECGRYQRDNMTLGKQVRHLLRALEEERGMIIPLRSQQNQDGSVVSAADIIDKHLVTFTSIEQLQQQNQQLLSIVKDLSAEQELADAKIESEEVKRLTAQVEGLSKQLESIKADRERVLSSLKTMHKERDLFKILLCKTREAQNMTPQIFQRMVSVACSSGPAIEDTVTNDAKKDEHIKDLRELNTRLQQEIEAYKKDIKDLRQEANQEIKLKEDLLLQAHSKIIDESKRAELLNDRNEILEENIKNLMTEHDELRVKSSKMIFEMNLLKEENARFQKEIDENKKYIDENKRYIDENKRYVDENKRYVDENKRYVDENKRYFDAAVKLKAEISDLKAEINGLKADNSDLRQKAQQDIATKESLLQQIVDEKARADSLKQQFLQMQELRNQERELRLDLDRRRRQTRPSKSNKRAEIQKIETPKEFLPREEVQEEQEVKPVSAKVITLKRRNLS